MNLRESIRKHILLEKKIGVISAEITTIISLEIDRTIHAFDRKTRPEMSNYNQREISNQEIKEVVGQARIKIAEKIVTQEIKDNVPFILKSLKWELAMPIVPKHVGGVYWELVVVSVFRESESNPMRTSKDQLVIYV